MKKTQKLLLQAALSALLLFVALPTHAATFTVSKLADTNDGACDADCSLREAITAANAAAGDDIIKFAINVRGAIDLDSTLPYLGYGTNTDIQGPGAKLLTVRRNIAPGTPDFRILAHDGNVSLSGLTLSNGRVLSDVGGAILTGGNLLTIRNCVFSGNSAGNGGAIENYGCTILIYNSTFNGNTSVAGGAIFNQPTSNPDRHMLISHCTFSGNTVTHNVGGAIFSAFPLLIEHSTFSGNSAPVASAVFTEAKVTLDHTILANAGTNFAKGNSSQAEFTSLGYNLASDDGGGFLTGPGDIINTDAKLAVLTNNGGQTPTHALLFNSPALNAGDPAFASPPDFDQRGSGFARVRGGRIDIGAYEVQNPALSINDVTLSEGNSGTSDAVFTVKLTLASPTPITVKYATADSSATAGSDYVAVPLTTLTFAPGETEKTIAVAVNGNVVDEINEKFSVKLSAPTNATIGDSEGFCTITDDDAPPSLSINDVSQAEGPAQGAPAGATAFTFTVTLSAPSAKSVTVKYATANPGSYIASAGVDYQAVPLTTLSFAPGETSKQITVSVNGDTQVEGLERFLVKLSAPVNASIADSEGFGTIVNDDMAALLFEDEPSQ